jgi:septum formation inhibitor-activating ATPase MinD
MSNQEALYHEKRSARLEQIEADRAEDQAEVDREELNRMLRALLEMDE